MNTAPLLARCSSWCVSIAVWAGCGDDLPPPPTECEIEAPAVLATWPPPGGDVPTDSAVVATFASAMDSSTLTDDRFRVDGVPGQIVLDGRTAIFAPDAPLAGGQEWTATVMSGVRDASGAPLDRDVSWTFETRTGPRLWRESQLGPGAARIAHGAPGELLAVWSDFDILDENTPGNVYAASYQGGAWSAAEPLGIGSDPRVTVDDDGGAWVLWTGPGGQRARRRTRCTGWEEAIDLVDDICGAVAVDRQRGTHAAVCLALDGEGQGAHVAWVFSATEGWSRTEIGGAALDGALAFDRNGRAHLLLRKEGPPCSAELVQLGPTGAIEDQRLVRADASCVGTSPPAIGFDAVGRGVAAVSGAPFTVLEHDPDAGWADEAVELGAAAEVVAVSPRGSDVAWTTPGVTSEIWAARRDGDGWTPAVLLDAPAVRVTALLVAATASGDVVLVATPETGPMRFARRARDADWSAMEVLPVDTMRVLSLSLAPGGDLALSGGRIIGFGQVELATVVRFQ